MRVSFKKVVGGICALTMFALAAGAAGASSVDVAVVDVTAPTGSVTLAPGGSGSITINMSVTGNQAGTATFEVYRSWSLSGGTFTGSDPQEFTVGPRGSGDPADTFSTTGTVSVASGQADGSFTLQVGAFDITNTNSTGAKLAAGRAGTYAVTVDTPAPADVTAPTIECTPAATDGVWHAANQSVECEATDVSGLRTSTPSPQTLSTSVAAGSEDGNASTGSYEFCDIHDNCATAGPLTGWKIDRKGPTGITFTGAPTTVVLGATFPGVTCSASDGGSGLDSCEVTGQDASTIGTKTLTATATDNVGNESTSTHSYSVIYDFGGFRRPVDPLPTLNVVKAGSAVPVKFSLGGDQGLGILAAGSPTSKVSTCEVAGDPDTIETTVTAGFSTLSYDAAADQYSYVWKTDKAWAGACRTLTVKLADGTTHQALFKLTK